jgi:hypothetical protein
MGIYHGRCLVIARRNCLVALSKLHDLISMEKLFVGCQAVALCFALGQLASSYSNIWPYVKGSGYTPWEIFKGGARRKTSSGPPSRILPLRFLIRVLRIFLTTAILALECTQSNPRAAAVISNTVTLIDSILEVLLTPIMKQSH